MRPGRDPQLGVEVGQWLVHQEHGRPAHDRPGQSHPLALSAGKLLGQTVEQVAQFHHLCGTLDHGVVLGARHAAYLEWEANVLAHGHGGVEAIVLEYHGDVAVLGFKVVDLGPVDEYLAIGRGFEPCDHPHRRGLAAA